MVHFRVTLKLRANGRNNSQHCWPQQCWELLRACRQWRGNGCNKSQHSWANSVGGCCARVGGGLQTDATTLNSVGQSRVLVYHAKLWRYCFQRDHVWCAWVAPTLFKELCKRIQHCRATLRWSRNQRNVGSCWLKTLTGFNLRTQLQTTCNKVRKRTQYITSNHVGSCWPTKLRLFAQGFSLFFKANPDAYPFTWKYDFAFAFLMNGCAPRLVSKKRLRATWKGTGKL